ncbi:MAG TPA: hypothetical protein VGJ60_20770 [Chloroflexota bacterium]
MLRAALVEGIGELLVRNTRIQSQQLRVVWLLSGVRHMQGDAAGRPRLRNAEREIGRVDLDDTCGIRRMENVPPASGRPLQPESTARRL